MAGWNDHAPLWKAIAKLKGMRGTVNEVMPHLRSFSKNDGVAKNLTAQLEIERSWTNNDRPYYDLYPSVAEAFTRVNIDKLKCGSVRLPMPQLLIRFQVGKELQASKERKIKSILVGEVVVGDKVSWLTAVNDGSSEQIKNIDIPVHTVNGVNLEPEKTILEKLTYGRNNPYCDDHIDKDEVDNAFRIVCAICLLKDNQDLIEPLPLDSDRAKWEETHDIKLIEKAARRGKKGWAVGKHVEVAPGFRVPHFAIRWCGKGGYDPQLRPIKGCFVHRKVIEEVPTDYLGPDFS